MVMLSELLRFRVANASGENSRLSDLVINQLDTDYPLVTHLVYRFPNQQGEQVLPWKTVKRMDRAARQIQVENYERAEATDT